MKTKYLFLFLILIICTQSCNDSSNPVIPINSNFTYPLKVGNKWDYTITNSYSNVTPDSIKSLLNDQVFNIQLSVSNDTLLDSNQVYELKELSNGFSDSYAYYSNEGGGFIKYAYRTGSNFGLPKSNNLIRFLFKGSYFNSIPELIKAQEESVFKLKSLIDSLIILEPPRIIYKYPLEIGKEWVFNPDYPLINKEIVGKEPVQISSGTYECFKIKWKYDFNMDGIWDEDFAIYEYLCSKGILKVTYTIINIAITTVEHPEGIGKADIKYERVLTSSNF